MHFFKLSLAFLVCGTMAMPTKLQDGGATAGSLELVTEIPTKRDFNSSTELISKVREHSVASNPTANQTDTVTSDTTTTMVGEINRESKLTSRAIDLTRKVGRALTFKSLPKRRTYTGEFSITKTLRGFRFTNRRTCNRNKLVANNRHWYQRIPKVQKTAGWILQQNR